MKRFCKCLWLNIRYIVCKQLVLFGIILFLLTLMFFSVERSLSFALQHYDYIDQYFSRTKENYLGLVLNARYANTIISSDSAEALGKEIYTACGEEPLTAITVYQSEDLSLVYKAYSLGLLDVIPRLKEGRWFSQKDDLESVCVVSAGLSEQYPIGSVIEDTVMIPNAQAEGGFHTQQRAYRVVGVLAEGEHPLTSTQTISPLSLSSFVDLQYTGEFVVFPELECKAGLTMWFCTDTPLENLQKSLQAYGTLYTADELTTLYKKDCIRAIFTDAKVQVLLLGLSILVTVSVMVINFGRHRQQYAIMYLLGQSRRMLVGCTTILYTGMVFLALSITFLLAQNGGADLVPSISAARWLVSGVAVLATLLINSTVWFFFRRSPMSLFTENK